MSMPKTLEIAFGPGTAIIWMNRPDRRNALDPAMAAELAGALGELAGDDAVRAIVLAARGPAFCAGADLRALSDGPPTADPAAHAQAIAQMLKAVQACPKPIVARVHGPCMGAGVALAAACDIAIATRQAVFGQPQVRLGLQPAPTAPYLVRAIGMRAARRWILGGGTIDAAEAWRLGLVHEICEPDEVDPLINGILGDLMLAHPGTLVATKALLARLAAGQGGDAPDWQFGEAAREGIAAFTEDRHPAWVASLLANAAD